VMGLVDLDSIVKFFGGTVPATARQTSGLADGMGTWGKTTVRSDIERALKVWARLALIVHGPLLNLYPGPAGDFGVQAFLDEAQHTSCDRVVTALKESFVVMAREFECFRTDPTAPTPNPTAVLHASIAASLLPLAAEQQTQHCARQAAQEFYDAQIAKSTASQKGAVTTELNDLKRKLEAQERQIKFLGSRPGAPAGAPHTLRGTRYAAHVTRHTLRGTRCAAHVTRHTLRGTRYAAHVTRHTSRGTWHSFSTRPLARRTDSGACAHPQHHDYRKREPSDPRRAGAAAAAAAAAGLQAGAVDRPEQADPGQDQGRPRLQRRCVALPQALHHGHLRSHELRLVHQAWPGQGRRRAARTREGDARRARAPDDRLPQSRGQGWRARSRLKRYGAPRRSERWRRRGSGGGASDGRGDYDGCHYGLPDPPCPPPAPTTINFQANHTAAAGAQGSAAAPLHLRRRIAAAGRLRRAGGSLGLRG